MQTTANSFSEPEANVSTAGTVSSITTHYTQRLPAHGFDARSPAMTAKLARYLTAWWTGYGSTGKPHRGMVLSGSVGSGKSVAARAMQHLTGALWLDSEKMAELYRNCGEDKARFWEQTLPVPYTGERPRPCRVAILDDLGSEPTVNDFGNKLEVCGEWIVRRYRDWQEFGLEATTIITTNLQRTDVQARYGDRIESRLSEMAWWIETDGKDWRKV